MTVTKIRTDVSSDKEFLKPLIEAAVQETLEAGMTETLGADRAGRDGGWGIGSWAAVQDSGKFLFWKYSVIDLSPSHSPSFTAPKYQCCRSLTWVHGYGLWMPSPRIDLSIATHLAKGAAAITDAMTSASLILFSAQTEHVFALIAKMPGVSEV